MSTPRPAGLSSLRALKHRDFAFLWGGAALSNIGTWMEVLALGVYVTKVTGRAEWTGGVAALTWLPSIVLSPLGGALGDRFDRRRAVALGALLQMALAGVLAALAFTGGLSVRWVAVISFLNGCAVTLFMPAFSALIAVSVPKEDLHSALSLNAAQANLGRICGPALAALIIAHADIGWVLLLNALSFGMVLLSLVGVRGAPAAAKPASPEGLWAGIARGIQVARADEALTMAMTGTLAIAVCIAPFTALAPVMAIRVFGQDAGATSMLVTAQGAGALLAALCAGTLADRLGRGRLLEVSLLLIGPVAAAYWLSPSLGLAAAAVLGLGALYMLTLTGLSTLCQSRVSGELQARIASLNSMLLFVGFTLGVWLQGALADRLGVRPVMAGAAFGFLLLAVLLRALRSRGFAAFET
ncbi:MULTISPECIES: MFS transporter [Corallococcus]|uniref:MFS transporter n=1 Tax=Corallococcus TaxID=83461 RepID=UPI00117F2E77|nr:MULTISPECIES: MFS transporter [Corallococcus]NBD08851.1 MFS transporter [Corallococcus silvisoli]TSC32799.1 MFS transporter [Corallococcus sp. Z5C101001]